MVNKSNCGEDGFSPHVICEALIKRKDGIRLLCKDVLWVERMDEMCGLSLLVVLVLGFVFPVHEQGVVHDGPLKHLFLSRSGGLVALVLLRSQRSGSKGGGMHSFFCFCDHLLVLLLLKVLCKEVELLRTFVSFAGFICPLVQGLDLCVGHPQAQGLLFPPARFRVLGLLGLFLVVEELVAVLLFTLELVLLLDKQGQADLVVDCGRVVELLLAVVLFELFSLFDQAGFIVLEKLDLDGDGAGDSSERGVY